MQLSHHPPRHLAILANPTITGACDEARQLQAVLSDHGFNAAIWASTSDESLRQRLQSGELDLMVALGGDGTMLRAGHLCAPYDIPILGINLGRFGFLTEVKHGEWPALIERLGAGQFRLERRMMLRAEHRRGELSLGMWRALNEVVVCRGQFVRPITLRASVDGYLLATYVADGLIAASPTGSTAYALAVGGPILPPELRNILVVPVAPHLSVDRAIVLSEGTRVEIQVRTNHEAVLSVDGHPPVMMLDGDSLVVDASEYNVSFVRFQDPGYFYRNLTHFMERNPAAGSDS